MLGGVADHLHRLVDALAARVPVTVLTSAPQNGSAWPHAYELEALPPLPKRRLNEHVGDGFAPTRRLRTGAHFLKLRGYGDRTIASITRRWGADAAVLIGIWDTDAHFWCSACRRAGVPYHLFAYGKELVIPLYSSLPEWRRRDFADAAQVIACSRATRELASERFGLSTPPIVVHPSVAPPPATTAIAVRREELRRQWGAGPVLLSVGRLVGRKGFDLVVRSVAQLRAECPGLHYVVAGDGPERSALEQLVRTHDLTGQVHLLGEIDETTKWAAYDACDVFVLPNRTLNGADFEGFGIVFLEAALAGRPSIAGRTGGASDAVVDDITGLLVDPDSPHQLTDTLRRLVQERPLRERLGRAGQERARTQFTPSAAADSLRTQLGWN